MKESSKTRLNLIIIFLMIIRLVIIALVIIVITMMINIPNMIILMHVFNGNLL